MSTSEKISLKESYVLEEDKQVFFNSLVSNSETYLQMRAIDQINRYGLDLPSESQKELKAFLLNDKICSTEKETLQLRQALLRLEKEQDSSEIKKILHEIDEKYLRNNYSYSKPTTIKESRNLNIESKEVKVSRFEESIKEEDTFEKLSEGFFNNPLNTSGFGLDTNSIRRLDLNRVLDISVNHFKEAMNHFFSVSHIKEFPTILKKFVRQCRKTDQFYNPDLNYLKKMTLDQLEEYHRIDETSANNKDVISHLFMKNFMVKNGQFPTEEDNLEEFRATLKRMYDWISDKWVSDQHKSFRLQLLYAILEVDDRMERYDIALFEEYLKNPIESYLNISKERVKAFAFPGNDGYWHSTHRIPNFTQNYAKRDELILRYLNHFFSEMNDIGIFEIYFEANFLKKLFYAVSLTKGVQVEKINEIYTEKELEELKESKILKFSTTNAKQFQAGEKVELTLEIKNIKNLSINIFEINPESYYRSKLTSIQPTIELTGLLPSHQINKEFNRPPIIKFTEKFEFEEITNKKRGIFVIEFIGGGLSSRVMIRKGSLTLVRQEIKEGIVFHIVNEEKEVCVGEKTGILINGKFRKSDESGKIIIPYGTATQTFDAVLIDNDYAELSKITIQKEEYTFDATLVFNEETLFPGNNAGFVIQPKLFNCSKLIPLTHLTSVDIEIESCNAADVKNSRIFKDQKPSYESDLIVSYMIPPKTVQIKITLNCKIKNQAEDKEVTLNWIRQIQMGQKSRSRQTKEMYVRKNTDGYHISILGRNGEPYPNQEIRVDLRKKWGISNRIITLSTDEQGEVHLGHLDHYQYFSAQSGVLRLTENIIHINEQPRIQNLPGLIDIAAGEVLRIPAFSSTFDIKDYGLIQTEQDNTQLVIRDFSSLISQEGYTLNVGPLDKGYYTFIYRCYNDHKIIVNSHRGERWSKSDKFLIKENEILKLNNQLNYLVYNDLKIENKKLTTTVASNLHKNVKAHIIGYNFVPQTAQFSRDFKELAVREGVENFPFQQNINSYFNQKSLSDEIKYVLERKRKNRFMGNTLEKPSGLLKRHFSKTTEAQNMTLNQEKGYTNVQGNQASQVFQSRAGTVKAQRALKEYSVGQMNRFLANKGGMIVNCKPDQDGKIEVDISSMDRFGSILVIIEDSRTTLCELIGNHAERPQIIDNTLAQSKSANKVYQYERGVKLVEAGETVEIKDLSSTEMSMVEDIPSVIELQQLLGNVEEYKEWEFLGRWNEFEPKEKLEKYDKFISHELNLFTYFKDPEFFELVVKKHIQYKAEKQLVDYFLLGDYKKLEKYLTSHLKELSQNNYITIALLLLAFRDTHKEECHKLVTYWSLLNDQTVIDTKDYKSKFDTVLTAQKSKKEVKEQENLTTNALPFGGFAFNNMAMNNVAHAPMMQNIAPTQMMMQNFAAPSLPMYSNARMSNAFVGGQFGFAPPPMPQQQMNIARNYRASPRQSYGNDDFYVEGENVQLSSLYGNDPSPIETYKQSGATNEYVERQYFQSQNAFMTEQSIAFWVDLYKHILSGSTAPFLSQNFIFATQCLTELISVLFFLGLPEKKLEHTTVNSDTFRLTAASNCMIFLKEMKEGGDEKLEIEISVSQKFFDPNQMFTIGIDGKSKMFKKVEQFITGTVYGSRVAITNSSDSEHVVQVITEIPQGSLPLEIVDYSKSTTVSLQPLSTQLIEFFFYFPKIGTFSCYPATINKDGYMVCTAPIVPRISVANEIEIKEINTLQDILSTGNEEDILKFMKEQNLHNQNIFNYDLILWLLKRKDFYEKVIEILRDRLFFNEDVWKFSVYHGDLRTAKEYLEYFFAEKGHFMPRLKYFKNSQFTIDSFQFKEYNPLINSRVHEIGKHKQNIYNNEFKETYLEFLSYLVEKHNLESKDYLYLSFYLLLQDRIDECLQIFSKINGDDFKEAHLEIHYWYLTAYLDLYADYPHFKKAREICEKYLTCPIFTWRNRFIELANQIAEFDGEEGIETTKTEEQMTAQAKNNKAAEEGEYLSAELENDKIKVTTKNIELISVSYYKIDLEIMFSQDPFISVGKNDYSFVKPTQVGSKVLSKSAEYETSFLDIPENLKNTNMLIQLTSGGSNIQLTYFPSNMNIFIQEDVGQVKITSKEGKPLSKVYVKCFSKNTSGAVSFHKDGYTDLRGTFDYASLNLDGNQSLSFFSLLISSDDYGAVTKEVKPPKSMESKEGVMLELRSKKWHGQQEKFARCEQEMSSRKNKYAIYQGS